MAGPYAANFTVGTPPQLASDDTNNFTETPPAGVAVAAGAIHNRGVPTTTAKHTKTYTLQKRTPGGATGSVTFTNGEVTSFTAPT